MRILIKILIGLVVLIILGLASLAALPMIPVWKDNLGGGKYQTYLEANSTPLDLNVPDANFSFKSNVADARFVMLAEMHGYAMPQTLDLALAKHLNQTKGTRIYLAELSPAQALAFNHMLEAGEDDFAREVFDYWATQSAQWANNEFFAKLEALRTYNASLPVDQRIRFVGVDTIYNRPFAEQMRDRAIGALATEEGTRRPAAFDDPFGVAAVNLVLLEAGLKRGDTASRYSHILPNIDLMLGIPGAENETFYALWGLFHGIKGTTNGSKPLAMRLNAEGGAFAGDVITIHTVCALSCFNMMPREGVPVESFRGPNGEAYTWLPMGFDNSYLTRLRGISDLKAVAGPDTAAMLFDLTADGTPYRDTVRLQTFTGYLAMVQAATGQNIEFDGSVADVMDYMILMQNSPPLTPWKGEAYDVSGGVSGR